MSENKSEAPTPQRLRNAEAEGDSPIASFATQSIAFLAAVALAPAAIAAIAAHAGSDLHAAIARAAEPAPDAAFDPSALGTAVAVLAAPLLAAAGVAAAITAVAQSGGRIATRRLRPTLGHLNVFVGLARLFSTSRGVAVVRAALFGAGVAWFAYAALGGHARDLAHVVGRRSEATFLAGVIALEVATRTAILGAFLAVLDVVVARWSWRKKLMMSRDEIKRELKDSDGDPEVRAARVRAHQEMLVAAAVAKVGSATVVVVGPSGIACALHYEEEQDASAPFIVASGVGGHSTQIANAARQHGIAVVSDEPLARALLEVEVGRAIPEVLYEPVAEALRDVWAAHSSGVSSRRTDE